MQKIMPIVTFTPLAKQKLSEALQEQETSASYLRIDVYASGGCACSGGYTYGMQIADKPRTNDIVEDVETFRIVTDKNNADILRGSKIDFVDTMQRQGFKIENPNVQGQGCGCGSGAGHGGHSH
ncbi:MAG TPA: iron-sulfur cluster assembly accessory protein [Nitrososphaerales archaeon]|nr:iron-sulfur cluster assembly accessory protein [Nitrososphaerales archaeon]